MKGSLRVLIGFMITYGAVGTLDMDPTADELLALFLAFVGLAIMLSGVMALRKI